ncbi:MAG: PQQ-like beta-propeller repeat protein [Planctomycetaceae bacterium]|nr:PQQ-like beta-propeller repeat protein [Planctomycetaceae bacterium]
MDRIPRPLLLLAAALGALLLAPTPLVAEDWPQFRGPRGDGTWQGPRLALSWPEAGPTVAWRRPLGGGYAGVVAAGGRVYAMDRQTAPREVERVLAFDAESGEHLWTHEYPVAYGDLDYGTGPRAAPTIHDGRVYTLGAVGHACCLDAVTGKVIWSKDFVREGAELPTWGLAASPLIWRDLVILHPGLRPVGSLVALDARSGVEKWRASADPAGYATPIVVEIAQRPRLIAWTPTNVLGLDPSTGEVFWSVPYPVTYGVSIAAPVFHGGLVFVAGYWEGSKAIRLGDAPAEATLVYEENRNLRGLMSQPLVKEGYGYLLDKGHGLICFRLENGEKVWDDGFRLTPRGRNPQASLVWTGQGDQVLALNAEGELILASLTPRGYEEHARAKILEPTWAHPAYAGARVYARNDQEIVAVELPLAE